MKSIIIYSSQTGFTERYARWIQEKIGGELLPLKDAEKKDLSFFESFDCIVYGGWAMAGKVHKSEWFIKRISNWKGKKLAMFCVGASPAESPAVEACLKHVLSEAQSEKVKVFYCQGGMNYEKMSLPYKMAMKAFVSVLKKKKDVTDDEKEMIEWISRSYDASNQKYVQPIVSYLLEE